MDCSEIYNMYQHQKPEAVSILIERGADVDKTDNNNDNFIRLLLKYS